MHFSHLVLSQMNIFQSTSSTNLQSRFKEMSLQDISYFISESLKEFLADGKTESLIKIHAAPFRIDLSKESKGEIRRKLNQLTKDFKTAKNEQILESLSISVHLGVYEHDRQKLKELDLTSMIETNLALYKTTKMFGHAYLARAAAAITISGDMSLCVPG
jgi:hypothetical protein